MAAALALPGCIHNKASLAGMYHTAFDPMTGRYINLDSEVFSFKTALTGVAKPHEFNQTVGFMVLLEEPHDPDRLPVLLLHGHYSGPRSMEPLGKYMDHERLEPWFAYYPTGLSIESLATGLRSSLSRVAAHEGVDRVAIVGYSMGGIVTRTALRPWEDKFTLPEVPIFISVSTPWAGTHRLGNFAWAGNAPESWGEMKPDSEFMQRLFEDPLPEHTEFHMVFGSGGNTTKVPGEDDGVTLPEVCLLFGMAPPYGGVKQAGQWAWAPSAPDAWADLDPDGPFLTHLFDDPLPEHTRFHIMYGTAGHSKKIPGLDDGVVAEASVIRDEAVQEASSVNVFADSDHRGIVQDEAPLEMFTKLLDSSGP